MINIKKQKKFSDLFKYFFEKRMMKILLLGAISGFPWVIIGSSLSLWLKEEGLSRSTIGWAGLIFAVYAFNYLWAPLIDRIYIPYLTKKIGHRKSWIFLMQSIILICLLFWNFVEPVNSLGLVIGIGLIVAIASATQDITVDALRIEQIRVDEKEAMSAGAAIAVVGWWTGYKLGGAISLNLAEFFENLGFDNYWELTFIGLGVVIILFNLGILFINEKSFINKKNAQKNLDNKILKKLKNNNVVGTSMANMGLETLLKKHNIGLIRAKVGDRYVKEKMISEDLNLGGEQSGHIILRDFTSSGDGIVVALQVLSILNRKKGKASDCLHLFSPLPQNLINFPVKERNILDHEDTKLFIKSCEEKVSEDGRIVVRMSGTEPLLRVMIESGNQHTIDELTESVTKYFS